MTPRGGAGSTGGLAPAVAGRQLICRLLLVVAVAAPSFAEEAAVPHQHDVGTIRTDPALSVGELVRLTAAREGGAPYVAELEAEAAELARIARRPLADAPAVVLGYGADGWGARGAGYRAARTGIEVPMWWPRQSHGRRRLAVAAQTGSLAALRLHHVEVAGWIRERLADLALADVMLAAAERDEQRAAELLAAVERAAELGERAGADVLLMQAEVLDLRLARRAAWEEHRHAADSYHLLTGLYRRPQDWHEQEAAAEELTMHPLLAVADARVARARAEVERLQAERWGYPTLALGSEHERDERALSFSDRFVLGVRIPLGTSPTAAGALAAARVALREAERDRARSEREARQRLAESEHALALAKSRVELSAERSQLTAEYLRRMRRGFDLGEVDLTALLRAQERARAAERDAHVASVLAHFHVAQRNQALGVVP